MNVIYNNLYHHIHEKCTLKALKQKNISLRTYFTHVGKTYIQMHFHMKESSKIRYLNDTHLTNMDFQNADGILFTPKSYIQMQHMLLQMYF